MTDTDRPLAWCYLTAALSACHPGTSAAEINALLARFNEVSGTPGPIDVRVFAYDGAEISLVRRVVMQIAEAFSKSCERECAPDTHEPETPTPE